MLMVLGVTFRRSALPLATNGTQERGDVLQGKMLNNAGTALQQQFIAFAGCGVDGRVSGEQGIDLRLHVVVGRNDVEEILDDAKIEI